jgi:hypothetical protein
VRRHDDRTACDRRGDGWLVVRGRGANGAFDRRYRFTDTWVKRAGRWQIVAAQDYVAP